MMFFFSVLPCCSALQVSIPQEVYRVADGEDVSMTCTFNPARPVSDIFVLKWEAYPDNPDDNLVRPNKNNQIVFRKNVIEVLHREMCQKLVF